MTVQGDNMLLVSLFGNLVSNSIKAMEGAEKGSGKIQVTLVPGRHMIYVQDNGCRIPAEDLPHVTKAFYMVDKSRSRRGLRWRSKLSGTTVPGWRWKARWAREPR